MALELISCFERMMLEVLVDEKIMVDGQEKTIYDCNFEPLTRQVILAFTDGDSVTVHKDEPIEFVKDVERPRIKPKRKYKK